MLQKPCIARSQNLEKLISVIFPLVTFLVVAILNFSTGSVWGIPAIVAPILLPLAESIGTNLLLVMGAIVSGATLGSHACFYSDATVLTSSCCKIENMDHALSQIPSCAVCQRNFRFGVSGMRCSAVKEEDLCRIIFGWEIS